MDLLGSILKSMDKPPSISDKQRSHMKKLRDEHNQKQKIEKEKIKHFREKIDVKINDFIKDPTQRRLTFRQMDQVYRSIIHEVAEVAGMTAFSFGVEGVDRYIIVFKREFPPSEDELATLRQGEEWSDEKAKAIAEMREIQKRELEESEKRCKEKFVPNSNYKEKYQHLIGLAAAKDAARKTETNKRYGFVPSENKKDQRSIEQTLADIQTKKRLKLSNEVGNTNLGSL